MNVYLNEGLQIEFEGTHISVDCSLSKDADFGILSHAHADHLPSSKSGRFVCSNLTYRLAKDRIGSFKRLNLPDSINMVDSGHIPGSSAYILEGDRDLVYTGDFSPRDRMHLDGICVPNCDVLIMESTYGHPRYKFPEQEVLENDIIEWFEDMRGKKVVCKGYSLGRAQEIEILARKAGFDNILVNKATKNMNSEISTENQSFSTNLYDGNFPDDSVFITSNRDHIRDLSGRKDISIATFTGWASDGRYSSSGTYDKAFILSDHADFRELISVVDNARPDIVYTIHGYKDRLAKEIKSRLGIKAQSLKKGQMTLGDF